MRYFTLLILVCCTAFGAPSISEPELQSILRATQSTREMGTAIAIVHEGKVLYAGGLGWRDRKEKRRVSAQTAFAIGSATKSFTALALRMLVEQGKLDLDKPLKQYLPDFALQDPKASAEVTARDLLLHRSGLPRHDMLWYFTPFTRENLVARLAFLGPNPSEAYAFRKGFQYNNLMYTAAGYLLERITGQSWESYVADRILKPLGMTQTTLSIEDLKNGLESAQPYLREKEIAFKGLDDIGPAGAINSTADDMAKWLTYLMGDGSPLVSKAGLTAQFEPVMDIDFMGVPSRYALGWFRNKLLGEDLIWHGGNIDGYSTFVSFLPQRKLGLAILTNQSAEMSLYFELPLRIYQALLPRTDSAGETDLPLSAPRLVFPDGPGVDATPVPTGLQYRGLYHDPGYGVIQVAEYEGKLALVYYGNVWELTPAGRDRYEFRTKFSWSELKLTAQFAGDVLEIPMESSAKPVRFRKVAGP